MTPFRVLRAERELGVLANIPHTGTWLPDAIASRLASDAMRALPMTDWHLHALYDFLPALGVTVVHATVSRVVGDLNRSATPVVLYPGRVETGVVPRETFWGDVIWAEPPSEDEEREWIAAWHAPYHARLHEEVERMRAAFGGVVFLDLHSVASRASRIHGPLEHDIYLGDRDGSSCGEGLTGAVENAYRSHGFSVVRNHPYKGGWNTHHYGSLDGVEALQIEMTQRCYMDEDDPAGAPASGRFAEAKAKLREVFGEMFRHLPRRSP